MQLQEVRFDGQYHIEAYGDGGFRMAGRRFEGSLLIVPGVIENLAALAPSDFDVELFGPVFSTPQDIEIMILGTGKKQTFPALEVRKHFMEHNIALESMDTGAACRTFNILASEERRVAAALIAI